MPALESSPLRQLSAAQVAARSASGEDFLLLDVREPDEFAKARIEGAQLLPLGQLPAAQPVP